MKRFLELVLALSCCAILVAYLAPKPQPGPAPSATLSPPPRLQLYDCPHRCADHAAQEIFEKLSESGPAEEQLVLLDKVLKIEPNSPSAHYHRALQLRRLHRYGEAVASASKAIELEPGFAGALNARAYFRSFLGEPGQFELGLKDVALALELEDQPTYYDTRGYLLLKAGRTQEALLDLDTAVRRDPTAEHLRHRAEALRLLGRVEEARSDEKKALTSEHED